MQKDNNYKIVPAEWIPEMNERAKYQNKWVVLKDENNDGVRRYLEIWPTFDGVYKIESYKETDDYSGHFEYESQTKLLTMEDLEALKSEYALFDWGKYEPLIREKQRSVWDRLVFTPCGPEISTCPAAVVEEKDLDGLVTIWSKLFKDEDGYREYVLYIDNNGVLHERKEIRKYNSHLFINTKWIVARNEVAHLIQNYETTTADLYGFVE